VRKDDKQGLGDVAITISFCTPHILPSPTSLMMSRSSPKLPPSDRVYVCDDKYGWLPGTIVNRDNFGDGRVRVRIDLPQNWKTTTLTTNKDSYALNKMERWVNLNDYYNHHLPIQNRKAVRDIAELPHLHEAAILYQLKERHIDKQPYTRVGDIIVAVNPYQDLPDLYSMEQQRHYAKSFVWHGT